MFEKIFTFDWEEGRGQELKVDVHNGNAHQLTEQNRIGSARVQPSQLLALPGPSVLLSSSLFLLR